MAYIRKRLGRWQSVVRVKGYPARTQSFNSKADAKLQIQLGEEDVVLVDMHLLPIE